MPQKSQTVPAHKNLPRRNPSQIRSQRRVEKILNAALKLFAQNGFDATTTNAIAELAGVSIGSLYQFFPNKIAILAALDKQQTWEFQKQFKSVLNIEVVQEQLEVIVEKFTHLLRQRHSSAKGLLHVIHQTAREGRLDSQFLSIEDDVVAHLEYLFSLRSPQMPAKNRRAIALVSMHITDSLFTQTVEQDPEMAEILFSEIQTVLVRYLKPVFATNQKRTRQNKVGLEAKQQKKKTRS